jgi:hypothetical protein
MRTMATVRKAASAMNDEKRGDMERKGFVMRGVQGPPRFLPYKWASLYLSLLGTAMFNLVAAASAGGSAHLSRCVARGDPMTLAGNGVLKRITS